MWIKRRAGGREGVLGLERDFGGEGENVVSFEVLIFESVSKKTTQ